MKYYTVLPTISVVNVFLLVAATISLFKRKHIVNFLTALAVLSIAVVEVAKFSMFFSPAVTDKLLGIGFSLCPLFWLVASISFLPSRSYSLNRLILSPLLGLVSLVFFLIWWIHPFFSTSHIIGGVPLSRLGRYFFVVVVLDFGLALSNLERSYYFLRSKNVKLLLVSALLFLVPCVLIAAYAVIFAQIQMMHFLLSSLTIFIGGVVFLFASREGFSVEAAREETAVHTSLVLFLLGGYLFFVGAIIKLFQAFGWNLHTLFSFLTAVFVFFVFWFIVFSSSVKERLKNTIFRHLTRQKYDWQKIWEDFTYKISLVTDMDKIRQIVSESIAKIMDVKDVKVFIFDDKRPFSEEFSQWLLRQGEAFDVAATFSNRRFAAKFPDAEKFFRENNVEVAAPLYGDKKVIGVICLSLNGNRFLDKELLKLLSLQASSVILNSRANQRLHEAERKAALYRLSTFVIHDVKNYVNSLSLLVANKDKFSHPEFQKDALFTLESTIEKMKALMEEFRTLRGQVQVNKQRVSISDIVEEALSDSGVRSMNNVELVKKISADTIAEVDSTLIYRVVLNLLLNAVEAMPQGGKLTVSVYSGGKKSEVGEKRSPSVAVISVEDTGCGMNREFIETKLFKPFATTKQKGLGIGLYQCKMIVEAHGGDIEVESTPGVGTTFKVILPVSANSE